MKIIFEKGDVIVKDIKCLDLDLTLDCGQAFRWEKQDDGSYCGVAGGYFLNIIKNADDIVFKDTSEDSFNSFWKHYFDIERDYEEITNRLKEDELLRETVERYYGIRILNQEPWEALCSFVISQQNNIKRIKLIINRLCRAYGKS